MKPGTIRRIDTIVATFNRTALIAYGLLTLYFLRLSQGTGLEAKEATFGYHCFGSVFGALLALEVLTQVIDFKIRSLKKTLAAVALLALTLGTRADGTTSEEPLPVFFVQTPGGVTKVRATDSLFALAGVGATVWTEEDWKLCTNTIIKTDFDRWMYSQVKDRTPDRPKSAMKTNASGMFVYEPVAGPPITNVIKSANVVTLHIDDHFIPIIGLNAEETRMVTNILKDKAIIMSRIIIKSDGSYVFEFDNK